MATTIAMLSNFSLSAPATSPAWTAPAGVTDINVTLTIQGPTDPSAKMVLAIERSQDGGATWQAVNTTPAQGGTQLRGPNAGQPMVVNSSTDISYPAQGDKYRAHAPQVTGTFTVTASVVTLP